MKRAALLLAAIAFLAPVAALGQIPSGDSLAINKTPVQGGSSGQCLYILNGKLASQACGTGAGTVTSVSVTTANGVSGSVGTPTTTPAISLTLGAITPTTVAIGAGSAITSSGAGGALASGAYAAAAPCSAFGTTAGTCAQGGVIAAAGPTGSATVAPIVTVNAAGQVTTLSSATVTPAVGSITGLGTSVATTLGFAANASAGFPTQQFGTFSPTLITTNVQGTPSYSVQVGSYEQIGRQVTMRFSLTLSGWTGSPSGNVLVGGFPIAATATANDNGICTIAFYTVAGLASLNYGIHGIVSPTGTSAALYSGGNTGANAISAAQTGTTPTVQGICNYHT